MKGGKAGGAVRLSNLRVQGKRPCGTEGASRAGPEPPERQSPSRHTSCGRKCFYGLAWWSPEWAFHFGTIVAWVVQIQRSAPRSARAPDLRCHRSAAWPQWPREDTLRLQRKASNGDLLSVSWLHATTYRLDDWGWLWTLSVTKGGKWPSPVCLRDFSCK